MEKLYIGINLVKIFMDMLYYEAIGKSLEELIIPEEMYIPVIQGIKDWFENGNVIPSGELIPKEKTNPPYMFSSHVMLGEESLIQKCFVLI